MKHPYRSNSFLCRFVVSSVISSILLAVLIASFFYACNELTAFTDREIKTDENVLWGTAFGQQHSVYKLKRSLYKKPDLLILGSSRVTQFRQIMAPGIRFYNASLAASNLKMANQFIRHLYSQHRPKVVLLGIDPWWFNPLEGADAKELIVEFRYREIVANALNFLVRPRILRSIFSGDLQFEADAIAKRRPIGFHASLTANGFRPDGSYQNGEILLGKDWMADIARRGFKYGFKYYRDSVRSQEGRFSYVNAPGSKQAEMLRQFILINKKHNVKTIIFFPPFAAGIWQTIQETPRQKDYFQEITSLVSKIAEETETEFFDFHDLADLGVEDVHTLDGLHVDEIATLRTVKKMISFSKNLSRLYEPTALAQFNLLANRKNLWAGQYTIVP